MLRIRRVAVLMGLFAAAGAWAHVGVHPSVHDTVASIIQRFRETKSQDELSKLTLEQVQSALTDEERHILGSEHITFRVNVPVVVYVMRDMRLRDEPFWLKERGFEATDLRVKVGNREFDVWKLNFDAGPIGLGVNSLTGSGDHYFVGLRPQDPNAKVEITEIYPGEHTLGTLTAGAQPAADNDDAKITELPAELEGATLLRGLSDRRRDAQLVNVFRVTPYPATDKPDHVVLTWSDDPKTTQTIQWRTSVNVAKGAVAYQKKADHNSFHPKDPAIVPAETKRMDTPTVVNDPAVNRHTVVLRGLEPQTTYVYAVGDGTDDGWLELSEFTTAPAATEPFSFIYMGDAQNGLERWGILVQNAFRSRPDAAFYVMAGDLVNRGAERDDWDTLFQNAQGVYDRRQLVPVLGNHEYQGGEPKLYLENFTLPGNGPTTIAPEKAYAFQYSNALFVILDSNQEPETQAAWLEQQLSGSSATWKFVVYHHPAYSSAPNRDNTEIRTIWGGLFDKYHVDLALQGHDHAYLRTYPMKDGQRVGSANEGTIYIVSVSGEKFYEQGPRDYTEVGMTNIATYQVLDIRIDGDRLVYRAYDVDGKLRDDFVIDKSKK